MSKPQTTPSLQELLQQSPVQVLDWLHEVQKGHKQVPLNFNWLGLAEAASFEARSQKNLTWAEVAVTVYQRLADSTDSTQKAGLISSMMHLKAFMITQLGIIHNDTILDPDAIIQWFFESLPYNYEQTELKTAHWRTLPIQEIKALKLIKSRLSVIASLVDNNKIHPDTELQAWLSLQKDLP